MYSDSESTFKLMILEPRVLLSADPVGIAVEDAMEAPGVKDTSGCFLLEDYLDLQDVGVSASDIRVIVGEGFVGICSPDFGSTALETFIS